MFKRLANLKVSGEQTLHTEESFKIIFTNVKTLFETYNVRNWEKNRPPDEVRVKQIKEFYLDKKMIDGTIVGWKKGDELLIYDGIHRLMAAKSDMNVICKIVTYNNEDDIINDYKRINSSVSLPELYLVDDNEIKVKVCNNVMTKMCKIYKDSVSAKRNPWKCNFNRDVFIENVLSKLDINFETENVDEKLFNIITNLNEKTKKHLKDTNTKYNKKCDTTNFFLMYQSFETIQLNIEKDMLLG